MNIGERIKLLRNKKGLKQSELAEMANISRVAVGNYERGDRQPDIEIAARIADALGISIDELTGRSETKINLESVIVSSEYLELENNVKGIEELSAKFSQIVALIKSEKNKTESNKLIKEANRIALQIKYNHEQAVLLYSKITKVSEDLISAMFENNIFNLSDLSVSETFDDLKPKQIKDGEQP